MTTGISAKSVQSGLEHLTITQSDKDNKEKFVDTSQDGRIAKQKKEFFALLSAQLQNQDPTQPMDTNQMSQQIFAINQVEQQLETNKHLQNIENHFNSQQINGAVSYIDKLAHYEGNKILVDGFKTPEMKYDMPADIYKAEIIIKNSLGHEVHREELPTKSGDNTFKWIANSEIEKGIYSFEIEAFDTEEKIQPVTKFGYGKIVSVITENGTNALEVNNDTIAIDKVQRYSNLLTASAL